MEERLSVSGRWEGSVDGVWRGMTDTRTFKTPHGNLLLKKLLKIDGVGFDQNTFYECMKFSKNKKIMG